MQYQQYIGGGKSSAQSSARENFFLKNTTSGKRLIYNTSRLLYKSTSPLNLLSSYLANGLERLIESDLSAQNPFRAEDFCSIIIDAHHKSHRSHIYILHFLRAL